jgi:predicted RND superfamily exporter protein
MLTGFFMLSSLQLYRIGLRYPKTVLALCLAASFLACFGVARLRVENNLSTLLPQHFDSVQALHKLEASFGGLGFLVVTVEGPREEAARNFAGALATRIESLPSVQYVDFQHPTEFFKERRWLYLDLEDLQEMERRLDRSLVLQKKGVSPTFNHLMDFADEEDRPDLTYQDIQEKYRHRFELKDAVPSAPEEGAFITMRVKARSGQQDLDGTQALMGQIRSLEASLHANPDFDSVRVRFTGDHVQALETVDFLRGRMAWVSILVMISLWLVLWLYFRGVRWMALVGVPLAMGILWTGGAIYLGFHHLNVLTGFAVGILGGLGSDYGIYVLGRYLQERRRGVAFEIACDKAFSNTGRATFASMLTTVFAFFALLFSDFQVSVEFGFVGAIGLVFNYVAMMLLIPAVLKLGRKRWQEDEEASMTAPFGRLSAGFLRLFYPRGAGVGVALVLLLCGISAFSFKSQSEIQFEDGRMDDLGLPGEELYKKVTENYGGTLQPTVLLTEGLEESRKVLQAFEEEMSESPEGESLFKRVVGISNFVPQEAPAKREILVRLRNKFRESHFPISSKREELIASFSSSLNSEEVSVAGLPFEVRRLFHSAVHPEVFAVYLFPDLKELNWKWMKNYSDSVLRIRSEHGLDFMAVDNPFVAAEFVQMMQREAPRMLGATLLFLLVVLLATERPLSRAVLIFGHLIAALALLSGAMHWLRIPLNTLNVAALPIVLGTGIDSFIHFSSRFDEIGEVEATVREKIPSILVSNLTTILGFGALLFIPSAGLRSLGMVSILGMTIMTLLCVFVFPRCLALSVGSRGRALSYGGEVVET